MSPNSILRNKKKRRKNCSPKGKIILFNARISTKFIDKFVGRSVAAEEVGSGREDCIDLDRNFRERNLAWSDVRRSARFVADSLDSLENAAGSR